MSQPARKLLRPPIPQANHFDDLRTVLEVIRDGGDRARVMHLLEVGPREVDYYLHAAEILDFIERADGWATRVHDAAPALLRTEPRSIDERAFLLERIESAVTLGSSNFSPGGMEDLLEAKWARHFMADEDLQRDLPLWPSKLTEPLRREGVTETKLAESSNRGFIADSDGYAVPPCEGDPSNEATPLLDYCPCRCVLPALVWIFQ